ncbi:MAG: hypothetical protein KUG77_18715 [Nannocystaceae bacterium]|nr:hypothetical protein [Nannocystaceae bacterium]
MAIELGCDLPFRSAVYPSRDAMLRVRVRCTDEASADDLRRIQAHGVIFFEAALLGMGAGPRVAPALSSESIDDALHVAIQGPGAHAGVLMEAKVVVDPSYVTVLFHKLWALHDIVPITEVVVELPESTESALVVTRTELSGLPSLHPSLPFAFEDDMGGSRSDRSVLIGFMQPPNEDTLEVLRHGMRVWISQALQGGYLFAHVSADDYFVSADDQFALVGDEVEWILEKCRVDLRGLNGMVHFLAGVHASVAAVKFVVLE